MKKGILSIISLFLLISFILFPGNSLAQQTTLSIATAGDTNMLELQKNIFAPDFIKKFPNVRIVAVGTGPGDPGSRAIHTKLKAQKDAGVAKWDIDMAVVHQAFMADFLKDDLLLKYVPKAATAKFVTSADSKNSLGTNVDGYVIPMFHSQVALAYNPKIVSKPPKSYEELVSWIKANPKKFGYNGIKGGMSGVAFVTGWTYWKTKQYDILAKGPYDKKNEQAWPQVLKELKALDPSATITAGNAGTLDMLNRGEIAMGPVWVDMLVTWIHEGRMDPNIRMTLIAPGLPGQPMYLVIPKKAANPDMALKYIDFISSPEIQAKYIVERNGWYPGIDAKQVMPLVSQKAKNELFRDLPPEDLDRYGLSFPLTQYFKDLLTTFEETK